MIVTVKDDYDKDKGTDLPMFSRVGKTTISMYIAFSQAEMNKHEEQEWLKQNPGSDINDYREKKKNSRKKNDDGGLGALKDQREKLLKDDQTVTLKEIEEYFSEIRNKRQEEKQKAEEERRVRKEALKQQAAANRLDKKFGFTLNVNKACTQNFKSQTRDHRERILSKLDSKGNGAPEVGKYNPKLDALRTHMPDTIMRPETGTAGTITRSFFSQTQPNQFIICEKVLPTLEEDTRQQIAFSAAISPTNVQIQSQTQSVQQNSQVHDNDPHNQGTPQKAQNQDAGGGQSPNANDSPTSGNGGQEGGQVKEQIQIINEQNHPRTAVGGERKKRPWDPDNYGQLAYQNMTVSPRYHLVIDRPIENDSDTRKLFTQPLNSNQYLVRRGQYPDKPIQARITKVLDASKMQGRLDFTMKDILRKSMKQENLTTASTPRQSNKLRSQSIDFKSLMNNSQGNHGFGLSGFNSPASVKSFNDPLSEKKLQVGVLTSLSWSQSKNFINIPKMIERVPGEFFIGTYPTQASYDLPTCIGEDINKLPRFHKMSGRYRRLHGNLLRNMNNLQKADPSTDGAPPEARPVNINYENMLSGYERLGHMKKLSVPFDMGKAKARDMGMLMQTEQYKNILYDNYKQQVEEMFAPSSIMSPLGSARKSRTAVGKKRLHKRGTAHRKKSVLD
ncbi:hypothetical protein FGO68_gene16144 [Halteria grandinella]|uniref:Uncharacterized protein n=1 Tax=Halteria grandinella TaxID=5974 RepID=A0A8J8NXG1_HALGN|nr:hypothetical protein FGO68_gene16144 [Halteria grandinella]